MVFHWWDKDTQLEVRPTKLLPMVLKEHLEKKPIQRPVEVTGYESKEVQK